MNTRVKDPAHRRVNRLIDRQKKAKRRQDLRTLKDPLDSDASFRARLHELKISEYKNERGRMVVSKVSPVDEVAPKVNSGSDDLAHLAELIKRKVLIEEEITKIIGRPALIGHVGEYVASRIFGISLHKSATQISSDGTFDHGPLAGRTVNVKWYTKREGLLDIGTTSSPDYYLVLTGPRSPPTSSRGTSRPWVIASVFLFDAKQLLESLKSRGVQIGIATSVLEEAWKKAEIYPNASNSLLELSHERRKQLALFG